MRKNFYGEMRIGVLGGGQLGRMMIQAGIDLNLDIHVLDPDPNAPCKAIAASFQSGKITDFETVYQFGKNCDLLTIEIENVNVEALKKLEMEGIKVFPQPGIIEMIQDKRRQKQFYIDNDIPTSPFILTESRTDVARRVDFLPAFHKLGREGYDGRGVQKLASEQDLPLAFDKPALLEKFVDFEKEISAIASRNEKGEVSVFPVVELVFHPEYNLVEYLFSPAQISEEAAAEAQGIAKTLIKKLELVGLLAVEMFLTKDGRILVNEMAPRTHNSGHHTIESNTTSQFEQHIRAILNLPLGSTISREAAAMVNLLGEAGYEGVAKYEGIDEVLAIEGVHVHLYGKQITKPFRKMGHVTIVDHDLARLKQKAKFVKDNLKVIA